MSIKSIDEILNAVKERIGDDTSDSAISFVEDISDSAISFIEDISDTLNSLEVTNFKVLFTIEIIPIQDQ